jgi:hypothetical protein
MICAECQDYLSEFIDGTLPSKKGAAVESHIRACPQCQALRDDLTQIIHASSNLPMHNPPSAVWARIEQEIGTPISESWWTRMGSRRFNVSFTGRHVAALAAGLAICASSLTVLYVAAPHALPTMSARWETFQDRNSSVAPVMLSTSSVLPSKAAAEELQRRVELRLPNWSSELRAAYTRGLATADARIVACEKAQQSAINDAERVAATLDAYRVKLLFLEQFGELHE